MEETVQRSEWDRFAEMPVSQELKDALAGHSFVEPTPIQKIVLPVALSGRDIFGQAQTGTGKTLAFAIPIVEKINPDDLFVQAVVLTPTRELARQVADEIVKVASAKHGLQVVAIYGGVHQQTQTDALRSGAQIVVGTPGRVIDLMKQRILDLSRVHTAVLDEVDEMLDMGFYDDVVTIFNRIAEERQTMFFSATIPERIQKLGRRYLRRPQILSTSEESVLADTTVHEFYEVLEKERVQALMDLLVMREVSLGLVFCRTKREVDQVGSALIRAGFSAEVLHGDLPQSKREKVMAKYRAGQLDILVATDVAARGIDVQGVSHVVNYHIPLDAEVYVHRTGRTGRAGAEGQSITFVSPSEYYDLLKIQESNNLHMECRSLPDKETVMKKRMEIMFKKLKQQLQKENIRDAYKMVKKEIPFFYRGKALAFVLKRLNERNIDIMQEQGNRSPRSEAAGDQQRLYVGIGKEHGVSEKDLVQLVCKKAALKADECTAVDLKDGFSFLSVPKEKAEEVIKKLGGTTHNGRRIKVEVSRARRSGGGGRPAGRPTGQRRRPPRRS